MCFCDEKKPLNIIDTLSNIILMIAIVTILIIKTTYQYIYHQCQGHELAHTLYILIHHN